MAAMRSRQRVVVPWILIIAVYSVLAVALRNDYREGAVVEAGVFAIAAVGLDMAIGYGRLIVLSAPLFMLVGALSYALLGSHLGVHATSATIVGIGGGCVISAALAFIIGALALRGGGLTLVLVTAFMVFVGSAFVGTAAALGGYIGIVAISPIQLGSFTAESVPAQAAVTIGVLAIVSLLCLILVHSPFGLEIAAAGSQPNAAESIGINIRRLRLVVFVLSSVAASVAGSMYAATVSYVVGSSFGTAMTFELLLIVYVGGRRTIWGPTLGALALFFGESLWGESARYGTLIEGLVFLVVLLVLPDGIAGLVRGASAVGTRLLRQGPMWRYVEARSRADPAGPAALSPVLPANADPRAASDQVGGREPHGHNGRVPVVRAESISVRYGGVRAVDDVTVCIYRGMITAIIGANGAGKTTLFNVIAGTVLATEGTVLFSGEDVSRLSAWRRARLGISRTFQIPHLFHDLTVHENVLVAARLGSRRTAAPDGYGDLAPRTAAARAEESISLLGLNDVRDYLPTQLPLGVQRCVEIARALATEPSLILLDEAASGLSAEEKAALIATIRQISTRVTVTLIEHDMRFVEALANHVVALGLGRILAEGDFNVVAASPEVIGSYLGTAQREER